MRVAQPRLLPNLLFIFFLLFPVVARAQIEALKELYQKAVAAYNNQQYDQAMDDYQQIIKIAPRFGPAYNGLALANEAASGDEDKTIQYLKTAVSYDPKLAQAYDNLGRIYYGRQDMDNAEKYFEQALTADPDLASAEMSLAWINLLVRSKPDIALKYFQMVLKVSQDPKIYYGMGSAYFATNQRSKALDMITKLNELGQDDLASRLEDSMRQNPPVDPNSTGTSDGNAASQNSGLGPLAPTSDVPTGTQVRLRGKLSDY